MLAGYRSFRIGIGFFAIVLLLAAFAVVAVVRIKLLQTELDQLVEQHNHKIDLANSMRGVIRDRMVIMNKMVLQADPFDREESYLLYYDLATRFRGLRGEIETMPLDQHETEYLATLHQLTVTVTPLNDRIIEHLRDGRLAPARELLLTQAIPAQQNVITQLEMLIDHYRNDSQDVLADTRSATAHTLWLTIGFAITTVVLSVVIAVSVVRRSRRDSDALLREVTERKMRAAEVELLQTVTSAANDANTAEQAVQTVLDSVYRYIRWPVGHALTRDSSSAGLRSMGLWNMADTVQYRAFRDATDGVCFPPGAGLPGRVMQAREPLWVEDVTADAQFVRTDAALACGIRAGFAFPVMIGTEVAAVLEFYTSEAVAPDTTLMTVMSHVGVQLGRVMERRQAEARLQQLAHYDSLTGLPNRLLFADLLSQTLASPTRARRPAAVLYLDLDRFKVINDTLGHHTGDVLLRSVSQRLVKTVRGEDTIARLGGDEFAILLPELSGERDVSLLAEEILRVLSRGFMVDGQELFVTGSVGVSFYPDDGEDAASLMKRADLAMYRAKHYGKNNYQLYARTMDAQAGRTLSLETQLRRAVRDGELLLHYQPKVSLLTGQITGMEALLRWQHPSLGLVSPSEFVPLLEETGMIVEVGEWILRRACEQNLVWQRAGLPPMRVAVNLSARQISRPKLVGEVANILKETGMEPRWLELEITESMLMEQTESATVTLNELDARGIHITIDDFGTGYSSLSYLKRFPISALKIDRSFVQDVTTDRDNAAIASAVIAMAHSLKMPVIAEGVETAGQLEFLRSQGCDEIQGFYFDEPLPPNEFGELLRANPRLSVATRRRLNSIPGGRSGQE